MQKYECDQCGACCRSLIVEADWLDAAREPKLLTLNPHVRTLDDLRDTGKVVMMYDTKTRACPFLVGQHGEKCSCSIYPTRPNECVGCEPGSPKCQQARLLKKLPVLRDVDGNRPDTAKWPDEWSDHYDPDYLAETMADVVAAN